MERQPNENCGVGLMERPKATFIVPGSLEALGGGHVRGGVHSGPSEWQFDNLHYVDGFIDAPGLTVKDVLFEAYNEGKYRNG